MKSNDERYEIRCTNFLPPPIFSFFLSYLFSFFSSLRLSLLDSFNQKTPMLNRSQLCAKDGRLECMYACVRVRVRVMYVRDTHVRNKKQNKKIKRKIIKRVREERVNQRTMVCLETPRRRMTTTTSWQRKWKSKEFFVRRSWDYCK